MSALPSGADVASDIGKEKRPPIEETQLSGCIPANWPNRPRRTQFAPSDQKLKHPLDCGSSSTLIQPDFDGASAGSTLLHARRALTFRLRIRPPLPGLCREPECDAAGPGNRVRHAEPLWPALGSSRFRYWG